MKPTLAKIIEHSHGLGTPSSESVRRRAQELAFIAGRVEFNEEDWRAAKRELHGGHDTNGHNGDMEMVTLVSERDMVCTDVGHRVENVALDDAENLIEELFAEGMDEAVHEQMLAARRADAAELREDVQEDE